MNKKSLCLAGIVLLVSGTRAQAHQIWLEKGADQHAVLRFGEFGENLREISPGRLDRFVQPTATWLSAKEEKSLEVKKSADGFSLSAGVGKGESIVAEEAAFPLRVTQPDGKASASWYWPAARIIGDMAAREARLTLDVVPTGAVGQFRVVFRGQPLAKAEVGIVVPSGWEKKARSDEQGLVSFDLPWKGSYLIEVSHVDKTPGERKGEKYDVISHVTTLMLTTDNGMEAVPASPAKTPGK